MIMLFDNPFVAAFIHRHFNIIFWINIPRQKRNPISITTIGAHASFNTAQLASIKCWICNRFRFLTAAVEISVVRKPIRL